MHPDLRQQQQSKFDLNQKIKQLGTKVEFTSENFKSLATIASTSKKNPMTKVDDYEHVELKKKLQLPVKSVGLIDVCFCDERQYKNRLATLSKCGVLRVVQLPFPT